MVRSDVSLTVQQAALHVWKTVVANTPKTLKEIMPVLMNTLISSLASASSERRQVAGREHFELILPDILKNCSHQKASVRDGHLTLFKYLPRSLGPIFQSYLPRVTLFASRFTVATTLSRSRSAVSTLQISFHSRGDSHAL
jgi:hypothetical protein